ncbi:hypothetical protein Tco_1512400, partial [Tanacetum coccineum]
MMMNQSHNQVMVNNDGGGCGGYATWLTTPVVNNSGFRMNNNKNNWKMNKRNAAINNINNKSNVKEMQQQNRLKPRRFTKKKYSKSAPLAPRNTTSFLIRAKKSGGLASLVSQCAVTPAVLPTPVFSPATEVLGDMAKEEWGVDGYGSMKGLIRLRNDDDEGEGEGVIDVERRLDHDLSRFEMVYPSNGGERSSLENRVDDQDSHIARLEEENMVLKERLFYMEWEFGNLRNRLRSLEVKKQNDSDNDCGSNDNDNNDENECSV